MLLPGASVCMSMRQQRRPEIWRIRTKVARACRYVIRVFESCTMMDMNQCVCGHQHQLPPSILSSGRCEFHVCFVAHISLCLRLRRARLVISKEYAMPHKKTDIYYCANYRPQDCQHLQRSPKPQPDRVRRCALRVQCSALLQPWGSEHLG
eukprot:jgi/Mesvir1/5178/Mv25540-RA.1